MIIQALGFFLAALDHKQAGQALYWAGFQAFDFPFVAAVAGVTLHPGICAQFNPLY